jgi:hypothetical protein
MGNCRTFYSEQGIKDTSRYITRAVTVVAASVVTVVAEVVVVVVVTVAVAVKF